MVITKYKEIFRLKEMLEAEEIPFVFSDTSAKGHYEHYQIKVLDHNNLRLVSVIEGFGTYGSEDDKLEIMGLLTSEEHERDSVCGYLTADDVFSRIKNALG